jgi:LPXTG-site transpeptidase (sortase) family protein
MRSELWPPGRELGTGAYIIRAELAAIGLLALLLVFQVVALGGLEHRVAQTAAFNRFRNELAQGIAPVGQVDDNGRLLAPGRPVALLKIPRLRTSEVVLEGTSSEVLRKGPGHLRNTVLPGQAGTSVILGRATAFGGPFGGIHRLKKGDTITTTTGIGESTFRVTDVRRAGDPMPDPVAPGSGRLTLVTATGGPFMPSGLLRVDADLEGKAQPTSPLVLTTVPSSELPLHAQTQDLWELVLLVQAAVLAALAVVWSWRRWGHPETWIVFFPVAALLGWFITDQIIRLLPNLM